MTRPRSELGFALLGAVDDLGPTTWRRAAPMAGVSVDSPGELRLARRTWENLVRRGELQPCGREKEEGGRVWRLMYERPQPDQPASQTAEAALQALTAVTKTWASFD